jgi:hypothetical protein
MHILHVHMNTNAGKRGDAQYMHEHMLLPKIFWFSIALFRRFRSTTLEVKGLGSAIRTRILTVYILMRVQADPQRRQQFRAEGAI